MSGMKTFIGAAFVATASAADLKLTWSDCGDSSTHTKISSFTPSTLSLGKKTTLTGTGTLDEDVSAATFDGEMQTAVGIVSCKGDASQTKTCNLPLGTGSLTFDAMTFPVKKGTTDVSVEISLSSSLPPTLTTTTTNVTSTASNGDKLFCLQVKSSSMDTIQEIENTPADDLKLTWSDCGDSSTHTKITGFTPNALSLGKKTTMTGTGTLDEDVSAATFDLELQTAVGTVSCKGDASQAKTCNLPLGTGSLTFDAMTFPIKKGTTDVNVEITLAGSLPPALAATTTKVTSTASNGDKLFCMEIKSSKGAIKTETVVV